MTQNSTDFKILQNAKCHHHRVKIENWLNLWLERYPKKHLNEMNKRIHSDDFHQFMSAYFELQIYCILSKLDCEIEIHPQFSQSQTSVDFGVSNKADGGFYIEAKVCLGDSEFRTNKNEEDVVEKIEKEFPNLQYQIWLKSYGRLKKTISKKRLKRKIQTLLDTGEEQEIRIGDWRMIITRDPIQNGKTRGRIWGPIKSGYMDGSPLIKKSLRKKSEDWKKKCITNPFVIAINACHFEYGSCYDEIKAIYPENILAIRNPIIGKDHFDSYLSEVAGILVFNNATLGNELVTTVRLFKNPLHKLPTCLGFLEETNLGKIIEI